jgi:hypothetical protein
MYRKSVSVVILTYCGNEDEDRLVNEISLREQTKPEINEDEILAKLSQCPEHVFACSLGPFTHVVVCIMLKRYTAEKQ